MTDKNGDQPDAAVPPTIDAEALKGLPNASRLSWGIIKQQRRGPKGELSIAKIVEAAIAIADQDGLSAVSMNRVASSLGYTPMSLYRYIESKEDLLVLMQDAVCDPNIPPQQEYANWREEMKAYVEASVDIFVRHPWYADIPIVGVPSTPNTLRYVDWAIHTMRDFPISDYEKMSFLLLLSSYARAVGLIRRDLMLSMKAGGTFENFSGSSFGPALRQLVKPEQYPSLYPVIASGVYTGEQEQDNPIGDDLDFGLERILDGMASYLECK
ncbi:TetR family transcriptional regulator [Paenibacillus sp. CCS19]|uniref:TetR/AcrR family transcriptional regulator n=1 Tax=Paenibacillus sp. CCS19 TaxID=3158387 RepID=UPI0025679984|nr:TetR/AcrR family transcriptional regulator [Paenibacillus cellulosilyticus]GMK40910.1 TetR family transcriptional regulator [Paenibacillus cellulosilyticus]